MSSTSTAMPSATSSPGGGGGGNGGPSSPLLFFVALGFGVVFTNLWIIVGVKYCFRYNQRNRARMNGDDPDGVDMAAMPRQRRRREKKLMTMEEVNEKFPLVKYKTWRSTRAEEGLPTAGGIANTPSRPASIKNQMRASEEEMEEKDHAKASSAYVASEKDSSPQLATEKKNNVQVTALPTSSKDDVATHDDTTVPPPPPSKTADAHVDAVHSTGPNEDEDEGDRIETAIPSEQLPDPGDACAICIDTLEDDDDIRGLTCGHAFHASCVDPWLTSRRACCPLCKADYHVPRSRADGEQDDARRRAVRTDDVPPMPFAILAPGRAGRRTRALVIPSRFLGPNVQTGEDAQPPTSRTERRSRWAAAVGGNANPESTTATNGEQQETQESRTWRQRLGAMRLPALPPISRTRNGASSDQGEQPPTPAQLEAGQQTTRS